MFYRKDSSYNHTNVCIFDIYLIQKHFIEVYRIFVQYFKYSQQRCFLRNCFMAQSIICCCQTIICIYLCLNLYLILLSMLSYATLVSFRAIDLCATFYHSIIFTGLVWTHPRMNSHFKDRFYFKCSLILLFLYRQGHKVYLIYNLVKALPLKEDLLWFSFGVVINTVIIIHYTLNFVFYIHLIQCTINEVSNNFKLDKNQKNILNTSKSI